MKLSIVQASLICLGFLLPLVSVAHVPTWPQDHHQGARSWSPALQGSSSAYRMAPLWRWSEDVQPRSGKDEALSEDMDHTSGSVGND
eukprot:UN17138